MRRICPDIALNFIAGLMLMWTGTAFSQEVDNQGSSDDVEDATLDGSGSEGQPSAEAAPAPTPVAQAEAATPEGAQDHTSAAKSEAEQQEQEQSQDAEPAVPATPAAAITETPKASAPDLSGTVTVGTQGGRMFGRNKVQLAANKPTWNEGQKCYDKIYGKPETYGSVSGDWYPLDWWVNPGITMRMGMYTVRGKAVTGASRSGTVNCDTLTVDENSKTTLLFVPLQLGPKIQFSPFRKKWLVADFWMAAEYDWFQETRDSSTAMIRAVPVLATEQVYTNTGHKNAISTGFSAHVLLNSLEERTVRSMVETMGIGYVYLTGFVETVKSTSTDGLTFGRNVMGIGFTFESVK